MELLTSLLLAMLVISNQWKITPSSSAATTPSPAASNSHDLLAARDEIASGGGKIVADSSLTVFSFAELKEATKNFPANALLGKGGFGRVYKGMLHGKQQSGSTETIITVKILNPDAARGHREWMTEIASIGKISHPNLAKLLGFCPDDENFALVYEFMPKGSLEYQLFRSGSTASLPRDVRLKIMVGAATGLAFLHNCCPMIHMDFRSANILLDGSYTAKLSDCGLEKSGPQVGVSPISKQAMGTHGYAAPEDIATVLGPPPISRKYYAVWSILVVIFELWDKLRLVQLFRYHFLVSWNINNSKLEAGLMLMITLLFHQAYWSSNNLVGSALFNLKQAVQAMLIKTAFYGMMKEKAQLNHIIFAWQFLSF